MSCGYTVNISNTPKYNNAGSQEDEEVKFSLKLWHFLDNISVEGNLFCRIRTICYCFSGRAETHNYERLLSNKKTNEESQFSQIVINSVDFIAASSSFCTAICRCFSLLGPWELWIQTNANMLRHKITNNCDNNKTSTWEANSRCFQSKSVHLRYKNWRTSQWHLHC